MDFTLMMGAAGSNKAEATDPELVEPYRAEPLTYQRGYAAALAQRSLPYPDIST